MPQTAATETTINEEVNEVLGATPGIFVRIGNMLLLGLVVVIMSLAAMISYPSVIEGAVLLKPYKVQQLKSPPAETELTAIQVKESDTVTAGAPLVTLTHTNTGKVDTLTAPFAGVVFFQRLLPLHGLIDSGTLLLHIQDLSRQYKVQISTGRYGYGKIHPGQEVYLSLDKFPRDEFGELTARIISKPFSDSSGTLVVDAVLTKDILALYGRQPDIGLGAAGTASIITGRKSFISGLFP
jgi:multidrug efflux pump subunit AcrA (membrane-fusion protein)